MTDIYCKHNRGSPPVSPCLVLAQKYSEDERMRRKNFSIQNTRTEFSSSIYTFKISQVWWLCEKCKGVTQYSDSLEIRCKSKKGWSRPLLWIELSYLCGCYAMRCLKHDLKTCQVIMPSYMGKIVLIKI